MKNFLIVDDHEIVRSGLKLLISDFYINALIMEASNGSEATDLLKTNLFDMIMLDIQMPKTNSFALLEYIVRSASRTKVLVFSMGSETIYGKRMMKAGAHGFLSKEASMGEIQTAIETVLGGRRYVSSALLESLMKDVASASPANPFASLSTREFEIATFLLKGLATSEIADHIHLQPSTVGTYKTRIFEKLNVTNVLELKELALLYNFS